MHDEEFTTLCAEKHQLFENIGLSSNMVAERMNDLP